MQMRDAQALSRHIQGECVDISAQLLNTDTCGWNEINYTYITVIQ
jgi:hypothetical protein